MNITYLRAINLIESTIHDSNKNEFKNFTQAERKECKKLLDTFNTKKIPDASTQQVFEKAHFVINTGPLKILKHKIACPKDDTSKEEESLGMKIAVIIIIVPFSILFIPVMTIQILVKGILNRLNLRIPSKVLKEKFTLARKRYLENHWGTYLNRYAKITFKNVDKLEDAKIIFLGDCHTERYQRKFRKKIIKHFAVESKNFVLLEGDVTSKTKIIDNKEFIIDSWEKIEDYKNHCEIYSNKLSKIHETVNKIDRLEKRFFLTPITTEKEKINRSVTDIIHTANNEIKTNEKKDDELTKKRDENLITKIKDILKKMPEKSKLFVVAGTLHLKDKEKKYHVFDSFPKEKCALIVPENTTEGAINGLYASWKNRETGKFNPWLDNK